MKNSLILLALSSVLATTTTQAGLFSSVSAGKKIQAEAVRDIYSGVSFHYLDKEDRLIVLKDLIQSIEIEYALLPLKKKLIGLDFEKLKSESIQKELEIEDAILAKSDIKNNEIREKIKLIQAKSNLDFLDRINLFMGNFKDTHFSAHSKISKPMIYSPVRFYRIDGKIVLGSIEKKTLSLASRLSGGTDLSGITIGDELLSIDGIKVQDRINELKKYESASSDEFADYYAVRALTLRNYKYPSKNFITIELKNGGTYKLPIIANIAKDDTPRLDALTYFKSINIPTDSASIGVNYDKSTRQWSDAGLNFEGYTPVKLHLNLKSLNEFMGDDKQMALRTGYFMKAGKSYGVMQILTFTAKTVKNGEVESTFLDAIRNFTNELKDNGSELILDLRVNGGGNGNYPRQVLGILAPENTTYPGETSGYRITPTTRNLEEPSFYQEMVAEDISEGLTLDLFKDMFQTTIEERRVYTPMISYAPIRTDAKVKGFNGKVTALITANCISACDKMSYLLKTNKRATIIGTHSNGTGAGFSSSDDIKTEWTDRLSVLNSRIPNHLFGIKGSDDASISVFEENSAERLCSENRPTVADINYAPTTKDLLKNNIGWLEKAVEVIESK